jgi:hypothetical protein
MPGSIPASKIPRTKRTPEAWASVFTNAVPIDEIPKPKEVRGMNQPGPIHLQRMFAGISNMM